MIGKEVESLGVVLDPYLDMNTHISSIKKYCIGHLKSWYRISHLLSEEVKWTLVKQIILSNIDYNNALLIGLPNYIIESLQRIVNWYLYL